MLAAFILVLFGLSSAMSNKKLRLLKESWKHENYTSFDHFWETEWGTDHLRPMTPVMKMIEEQRIECKLAGKCPIPKPSITGAKVDCVNGNAGGYECQGIDMLSFVSLSDLGSGNSADGNDIWGYTDANGRMYAITGQTDGASIVDVTDPVNPEVLVFIQSELTNNVVWRDMKVYGNYVYIVADGSGHGLQTVNLDTVIAAAREGSARPMRINRGSSFVNRNTQVGRSHNIVINSDGDQAWAYCVGSSVAGAGLGAFDLASPGNPSYSSTRSFPNDGYTHDAECVTYRGPDTAYNGQEICFGYNENSLTIVQPGAAADNKQLARQSYNQVAYTHQGWITDDHQYVLMNDELDESRFGIATRTLIWDVRDLNNPIHTGSYSGPTAAIDHNLYIRGNTAYEANYRAGLRVLDISNIGVEPTPSLEQIAYFKTWTGSITASFNGAWSVYPYFDADFVVVQDIEQGLFVLSRPS